MQMTKFRKALSLILCMVLIAATALFATGCSNTEETPESSAAEVGSTVEEGSTPEEASPTGEVKTIGEGSTAFTFIVTDGEGVSTTYEINTDQTTVGGALVELGLIDGKEDDYGLYVTTVDGLTVEYETDGKYWAFYVDGEYGTAGVDMTDIVAGSTYEFRVE